MTGPLLPFECLLASPICGTNTSKSTASRLFSSKGNTLQPVRIFPAQQSPLRYFGQRGCVSKGRIVLLAVVLGSFPAVHSLLRIQWRMHLLGHTLGLLPYWNGAWVSVMPYSFPSELNMTMVGAQGTKSEHTAKHRSLPKKGLEH